VTEKTHENVQYHVEVYEPGSADDVWVCFKTTKPLFSISRGDIVNPGTWPNSKAPMRVLRVVAVEHIIWEIQDSHIGDKLCVFTEEVEGTRELRKGLE
jgi:hypothetical protein